MKIKLYLSVIAILVIAISSCKKLESLKPNNKLVVTGTTSDTDVYVVGYAYASDNRTQIAAYWKNGALSKLSDSSSNAYAESVVVHDSDVLISATIENPANTAYQAVYYRNGHEVVLANNAFVGMSHSAIFTDCGCDYYICGSMMINGHYKAVYWKNDVPHLLPSKSPQSFALGITVQRGNVYVAGSEITTANTKYAVYWKNDTAYNLTDTLSDSEGRDIGLVGNDIYVAGYSSPSAGMSATTYWKNGVPTTFDGNGFMSIVTRGSNFYLAGNGGSSGKGEYWVNNTVYQLPSTDYQPTADGIAVLGSDVYVTGAVISNLSKVIAAYWKNGAYVPLPAPHQGQGLGITVRMH